MPTKSSSTASSSTTGAIWLNGIAWGVIALSALGIAKAGAGSAKGLEALFTGTAAAFLGMAGNLLIGMYQLACGRSKQAGAYFIGFLPLAVLFGWAWYGISHLGKIGG